LPYDTLLPTPDESFLLRALEILRRRAVPAVVVFATILASAVAFARYLPDLFRANAVVLVERQLSETFVRPAVGGELESRLHVIKQEVLSRARLTDLIRRFDLYAELRARGDIDTALEHLRRDIQVELTGPEQSGRAKTVAFNLTFTGSARDTVAEVTNAIAEFYVAQNSQMRSEEATRTTQFLKAQMEDAKAQLDQNERQVEAYTSRHVGELPQQVEVNLATLERLNGQLQLNGERQIRTLDQREKLFDVLPAPPARPVPVATMTPGDVRLERLKRDLAQLEGFPDKHPDVRRIKDEITTLEAEAGPSPTESPVVGERPARAATLAPSRIRTIESLDAELDSLRADDATLRQTIATVERRLEGVPYRQNEFALLSRDHQATRDQYESLLKRYDDARVAESMETENQGERFRILEGATPPTGPSAPNRLRLLIMGLFVAALAAGLTVLLVEQYDTSFHTVNDLRQFTRVPVLVSIPRIGPSPAKRLLRGAVVSVSMLVGLMLVGTLSAYIARDNEPLVRLLVRGG
jgi:polysaccharide biosynthesis transport protein